MSSGEETRYPHLEKLALALVTPSQKYRPYFQYHPIVVVMTFPLRNVLHQPELSGQLAKQVVEISECDIELNHGLLSSPMFWPTS